MPEPTTETPSDAEAVSHVDLTLMRERITAVDARIRGAAARAQRPRGDIEILLATKTQTAVTILHAQTCLAELGLPMPRLGENRSREGRDKAAAPELRGASWSMIGHVQSNKTDEVLAFATEMQSLDRVSVARELEKRLLPAGRILKVLVQVKTAAEDTKFGLAPVEVPAFLRELAAFNCLKVGGFMTLATKTPDPAEVRRCFRVLRDVRDQNRQNGEGGSNLDVLSMGMSSDFELAVEEGATCLRLGEAIFGKRAYRPPGGWWATADSRSDAPASR